MNKLLNAVKVRLQYTSFREEREFLHALKGFIEDGVLSKGEIQDWMEEIQAFTCGPQFSSVYNTCTALLDEFFPEELNPFAQPISNECEQENIATL